jgi:hypothetical protein
LVLCLHRAVGVLRPWNFVQNSRGCRPMMRIHGLLLGCLGRRQAAGKWPVLACTRGTEYTVHTSYLSLAGLTLNCPIR